MAANMRSDCQRCGTPLRATRADPTGHCLALTFASLVLFAILWLAMLMKVSTAGIVHETTLLSGPAELVRHGLWPLAIAVAFTTAAAPFIKFAGTLYVLIGLRLPTLPPNLRGVFLISRRMGTWAMLEVLLLGVFVAYTKLGDLVTIHLGPAVYAPGSYTHLRAHETSLHLVCRLGVCVCVLWCVCVCVFFFNDTATTEIYT